MLKQSSASGIDANMTFPKTSLLFLCLLLPAYILLGSANAHAQSNQPKARIIEHTLATASSPSDSLRILIDVYNLSDKVNRDRVRGQILTLVQRSDNNEVTMDVLHELAKSTDDTDELARLIEISDSLSDDESRQTLQTVLQMEKAEADASTVADSNVHKEIVEYVRQGMGYMNDPYKEIQNIYRAMVYLGASSQGPLYFEYINRLEDLVNQLPDEDYAIKNLFYTTAAIFYTRKRDYKKAIELDRKLISELDKLMEKYDDPDKGHRELDYFYYVSYRRMLRNFKGLSPQEIEDVYNRCISLAETNEKAAEEFGSGGLVNSYYYMATKQYDKAIPNLKKALSKDDISDFRKSELLGHLAFATRQTADKEEELKALRGYTQMLLKDRVARRNDMYKEIELRNSVTKIVADEYRAQEQQRQQNRVMRKTAITLVYVLALILIFLCGAYLRLRNKVKDLELKNGKLRRNIEHIFDDGVPKGTQDIRHKNHGLKG